MPIPISSYVDKDKTYPCGLSWFEVDRHGTNLHEVTEPGGGRPRTTLHVVTEDIYKALHRYTRFISNNIRKTE